MSSTIIAVGSYLLRSALETTTPRSALITGAYHADASKSVLIIAKPRVAVHWTLVSMLAHDTNVQQIGHTALLSWVTDTKV